MSTDRGFTGTQPVKVLDNNVLAWFEEKYPDFPGELGEIGKQFACSQAIKYVCDEAPILGHQDGGTPYVTVDQGQITIHETFLSYVWALSYAFLVIFDEKIQGPRTGKQPGHGKPLGYFLPRGYTALDYALGLITEFSKWPPDLPSPERYNSDGYYVERANAIYLAAVDFILCHELAHIAYGHLKKLKQAEENLTLREIKVLEREADKWALDRVSKGIRPPERSLTAVGFGAVVGLGSLLFLNPHLTSLKHPDKDERIRNVLTGLPLDDRDNLWGVAAAFYVAWDSRFNAGLDFSERYETYGALVVAIESQLASKKQDEQERTPRLD